MNNLPEVKNFSLSNINASTNLIDQFLPYEHLDNDKPTDMCHRNL